MANSPFEANPAFTKLGEDTRKVTDTNVTALLLNRQLDISSEFCPLMLPTYKSAKTLKCIAFTDDYSRPFVPDKTHFRSETVDLQRGEAEWSGGNLYFDQWDYDFAWQLLPAGAERH